MPIKSIIDSNSNSFKDSTCHQQIEQLHKALRENLTKPQRRMLMDIVDKYDLLLEYCAEENYKTGMRDGFRLTSFLHKTPIKFPKN